MKTTIERYWYNTRKTCDNNPVTSVTEQQFGTRIAFKIHTNTFFLCFISFIPLLLYIFIRLYIHTYDSLSQYYYNPSVVRYSRQKKRYFHSLYFILFFFIPFSIYESTRHYASSSSNGRYVTPVPTMT